MDSFWNQYPIIKDDLDIVVNIMKKNLKCRDKFIQDTLYALIDSGGKMLRPAFLLTAARFGEFDSELIYPLAACIEMLHMSTLVHDDIVDDSEKRRGSETIQSKYGKDYAVYMGDFLFCTCFKILSESTRIDKIKLDSKVLSRICIGEIDQYSSQFNLKLSVRSYLRRISSKTAELFSLSFYTGAADSGCSTALSKNFWHIGHDIGMAFQIIDDILDYTGDEKKVGKPLGTDIKQGIFTLPLIYANLESHDEVFEILSKENYDDTDVSKIIKITKENGGIEKAKKLAHKYSNKAYERINMLPENEYKHIIYEVAKKLLERDY
jgi:heptaprenyl diphosphate synthase